MSPPTLTQPLRQGTLLTMKVKETETLSGSSESPEQDVKHLIQWANNEVYPPPSIPQGYFNLVTKLLCSKNVESSESSIIIPKKKNLALFFKFKMVFFKWKSWLWSVDSEKKI